MAFHDEADFGFAMGLGGIFVFFLLMMGGLMLSDAHDTNSEDKRYSQCLDLGKDWDEGECKSPSK